MIHRRSLPSMPGFTLAELLVCVGIMTMILGITLSSGPQVLMRLSLADTAYSTELLIREAQIQGSAINSVNGTYGGAGVYFARASSTSVLKFRDRVDPTINHPIGIGNGLYDTDPIDEREKVEVIKNNHKIAKLCVTTGTDPFTCNDANVPPITSLTISYIRPNQTTQIYVNNSTSTNYAAACIQLDSLRAPLPGYVRSVVVYRSGMITKSLGECTTP